MGKIEGGYHEYARLSDHGEQRIFSFCPECGATVFYGTASASELIAVPVGAFADPAFPAPTVSVRGERRHSWIQLQQTVEQHNGHD